MRCIADPRIRPLAANVATSGAFDLAALTFFSAQRSAGALDSVACLGKYPDHA